MEAKVLLDPKKLSERLKGGDVILLDTRDPESFAAGHIPGAVNAHDIFTYLSTSTPEGQEEMRAKFTNACARALGVGRQVKRSERTHLAVADQARIGLNRHHCAIKHLD